MGVKHRSAATRSWSRDPTPARWTSGALRHEVSTDERDLDHPSRGPAVLRPHRSCGLRCARGPPSTAEASDWSAEDLHLGRDEHAGHGVVPALLPPRRDREGRVPNGPSLVRCCNINSRPMWPLPSLGVQRGELVVDERHSCPCVPLAHAPGIPTVAPRSPDERARELVQQGPATGDGSPGARIHAPRREWRSAAHERRRGPGRDSRRGLFA